MVVGADTPKPGGGSDEYVVYLPSAFSPGVPVPVVRLRVNVADAFAGPLDAVEISRRDAALRRIARPKPPAREPRYQRRG